MHGCKFELIVRIPKVYSCIFLADFPSLRTVGACEPLLEKQNITFNKKRFVVFEQVSFFAAQNSSKFG